MSKRFTAVLLALVLAILPVVSMANQFDPSHALAYMSGKFTCGCSFYGTGAMIGRRGLITAGSCLYCYKHGKPLQYCNFLFGARNPNSGWYRYDGKFTYRVYDTFSNGYDSANDIGYVVFNSPVGDETGWFGWQVGSDWYLDQEYTHMVTLDENAKECFANGVQYVINDKQIKWSGYPYGAAEGGPVFFDNEDTEYQVVAVYTSHDSSGNGIGRRLTSDVINDMTNDGAFR